MVTDEVLEAAGRAFVGGDFIDESEREAVLDGVREAAPVIRAAVLAEVSAALDVREKELRQREHRFAVEGRRSTLIAECDARQCEVAEVRTIVQALATLGPTPQPPTDELAAARERREGTPISLDSRIDAGGNVVVDVDLGKPPGPRKT